MSRENVDKLLKDFSSLTKKERVDFLSSVPDEDMLVLVAHLSSLMRPFDEESAESQRHPHAAGSKNRHYTIADYPPFP